MKKFSVCASLILAAAAIYVFSPAASAQTASTNIELTGLSKQSSVGRIGVTLGGVELEDSFQRQSKSRGLNPAVFREELVGALKELHPGTIRTEFPDLGQQLANRFTVPGAAVSGKSVSASAYSLGEFLQLCAEVGSDPWLRIPSGTTPDQMREVVEYLSGTGSDAWSAARIASGQSEPWTQVFGTIHVELGNEYVSGAATSEWMTPAVYAERANTDFGAARDTAGFDSSKFDLMLSGSGVSAQWAAAVLPQSREQDSLAITADLPKLGASASQAGVYAALLAEPEAMDSAGGLIFREVAGLTAVSSARRTSINAGQSRLSLASGLGQLAQSWGASLAQTEHVLQMMALGVRYQNGTVLTENSLHCADENQAANCRSAQFLSDALANGVIGGTMLQTVQTGANPSRVQELNGNAVQAHALQSFAFAEGGKVSLVVFNLSPTAALPVTFSGNNAPAGDVQMAQIAPRDITNSNQNGTELQPSKQTLSDSDLSSGLSLPPYSMTVLNWEAGSAVRASVPAVSGAVKLPNSTEKLPPSNTLATAPAASTSTTSSQPLINCPNGFNATAGNQCYVLGYGPGTTPANYWGRVGYTAQLNGTEFNLQNASTSGHTSAALNFGTQVNVQAFTTTFQFVPNGWNIALVFNNSNNNPDFNGAGFVAGAGCEGGFFQAFGGPPPNNVFALMFDQWSSLTAAAANFTYSSVQTYTAGQSPCNPDLNQTPYIPQNKISTSPVPLNSPATTINTTTQDTYSATVTYDGSNLTVNLYDVTKGGTCSPSTSPTCFSHTWTGVDIPTAVGGDTAWVGFTSSTNSTVPWNLYLNSFVYTVNNGTTAAATPTFSPVAGTYVTAQTVSMSDATSGATIYYTTNGTTPTTSSTKYTGAVTVSATETLKAIAVASGYSNSAVASAAYTISPNVPAPTFSPAGGTYAGAQKVTISDTTAGTTIHYTTNGTTPTTSSTVYTGAVTVSATQTLKAIAVATGDADAVGTATYTIMSALPAPTFSVAAGTYTSAQTVSVSDATAGTTIYYTTNGTTPTTSSTKYAGAVTVSATETLEAMAIETGYTNSPAAIAAYTISLTAVAPSTGATYLAYPTGGFTASGLLLTNGASVTGGLLKLTDGGSSESRAAWFAKSVPVQSFTTDFTFEQLNAGADGMTFTIQASSSPVQGALGGGLGYQNIPKSVAVKFDLYNNNGEGSDSTGLYTDGASPTTPYVNLSSTPINLHSGDVMHAHLVYNGTNLIMTLTDTVTGGSVTEVFPVNIPSIVGGDTAYVGFTGGTGGSTSTQNVLSWTYSVPAAAPAFSPAGGSYGSAQSVTISDTAAGAAIYYTTNGNTPTTSSTKYTGPVTVDSNEILKAVAVTSNGTSSAVVTANYNVEPGGTTYLKYPTGGFTASGLSLTNGASVTGSLLQLTDGGSSESRAAWFAKSVPVQSFTTDFTFQQLNAAADGMTFTIQASSSPVQGALGGGLGYQNIPKSIAVKFDLYNNNGEGSDSTGLYTNGASPTTPSVDLSSTPINLHSGDVMHAYLVYNGTDLTMTLIDTVTGGSVTEVFPVNIPSIVGGDTAYVGFTGGTGGSTATQNILSWTFVGPTN